MIILVGHLVQNPAKACHMVVEGRISPVRGHHRVTLLHKQPHHIAQQPVDAFPHDNVIRGCVVMRGKRLPQIMAFGVAVHPMPRLCHRLDRVGGGAKDILIRAQTGVKLPPHAALLCFRSDKGDSGGQGLGKRGQAILCHMIGDRRLKPAGQGLETCRTAPI